MSSLLRFLHLAFILLLALSISACTTNYTKNFQKSDSNYGSRTGHEQNIADSRGMYGRLANGNGHRNKTLLYNEEMSKVVSDMPGVFSGVVMETDQNAYAAVIIDSTGTGVTGRGNREKGDHIGTTRGMYDWMTGSQYADPNQIANDVNSYYTVDNHRDLSDLFKKRIAEEIRKLNPDLKEVHITANRDFINQMSVYREEARQGVNLNGYLSDFNRLATRHFGPKKLQNKKVE